MCGIAKPLLTPFPLRFPFLDRDRYEPLALTGNKEAAARFWGELKGAIQGEGNQVSLIGEPDEQ